MKQIMLYVERFTKIAAAISIVLISCGYLGLICFYNIYSIDISSFIGISEIITISFSFLVSYFVPLVISFFIMRKWVKLYENQQGERNIKGVYLNSVLIISGLLILLLLMEVLLDLTKYYYVEFLLHFLTQISLVNVVVFLFGKTLLRKKKEYFQGKYWNSKLILIVYLITFPLTFFYAFGIKIVEVYNVKERLQTNIYLMDNSTIVTNDSIKYLGKTDKYFFIWNKNSKIPTIYPTAEIKKIEITKRK